MPSRQLPDSPQGNPQGAASGPTRERQSPALEWIMHYAVPLIGVIGAALYGVLRLAYLFFYLPLRATPDEVGYGYSQVLADELIGAIELIILTALCIVPLGIAAYCSVQLFHRMKREKRLAGPHLRTSSWTSRAQKLVLWCFCIAIPLVFVSLPVLAWLEGQEARSGFTVRNVYISHFIALPVLAVEAVPATITWVSASGSNAAELTARQCLLYLGDANNDSVFYDVHSQESLKIPSSEIIITLQDTTSVPIGC